MSRITCNTAGDILPLYIDDVVSDDTRILIEEHLESCDACRKRFEDMKSTLAIPVEKDTSHLENFKKAWHKRIIMIISTTVVLTAAIMCCAYFMPQIMWNLTAIFVLPLLIGCLARVFIREWRLSFLLTVLGAVSTLVMFIISKNPPVGGSELYGILTVMFTEFSLGSLVVGLFTRIRSRKK